MITTVYITTEHAKQIVHDWWLATLVSTNADMLSPPESIKKLIRIIKQRERSNFSIVTGYFYKTPKP